VIDPERSKAGVSLITDYNVASQQIFQYSKVDSRFFRIIGLRK
jgi:hypothetical protein